MVLHIHTEIRGAGCVRTADGSTRPRRTRAPDAGPSSAVALLQRRRPREAGGRWMDAVCGGSAGGRVVLFGGASPSPVCPRVRQSQTRARARASDGQRPVGARSGRSLPSAKIQHPRRISARGPMFALDGRRSISPSPPILARPALPAPAPALALHCAARPLSTSSPLAHNLLHSLTSDSLHRTTLNTTRWARLHCLASSA